MINKLGAKSSDRNQGRIKLQNFLAPVLTIVLHRILRIPTTLVLGCIAEISAKVLPGLSFNLSLWLSREL